jgi:tripartite ATP-independent transporter DctM subunit
MDPNAIGLLALAALLLLLAVGVPVAVALGGLGVLGLAATVDWNFALATVRSLPHSFASSYVWTTMPLFVLMGNLAAESGITVDLFRGADHLLRRVRGGMYLAVVASSALFSAVSGSTVVNSVVFTRLALPEMLRLGYSRALSLGCICSSGTFAAMIPPSLTLVLIGLLTEQSIGKLFVAGVIPGLVSAVVYALTVFVLVRLRPHLAPDPGARECPAQQGRQSLRRSWPAAVLFLVVLGGIYWGWFAPSSAGAVGACGALVFCLKRRGCNRNWLRSALNDSVSVTSSILIILIGGLFFSRFLVVSGVVDALTRFIEEAAATPAVLIFWLAIFYILIGLVLDTASIMIVTLPIVFPVVVKAGIEPIWFSILFTKFIEVAVFSPPIGVNIFATLAAAGKDADLGSLCKGVLPFLIAELVNIALLIAFPCISNWLPGMMA